ncbi:MAG: T9SS type A sorting domain-containing protein, partial [Crocinitomicaceae bacterium]|nr:T9SS type A sorting domain-containing protein [Crocinitomicaceae bacterium]
LKVAPNPFEQQFTVSSAELIQALTLRDAQGKVMLQQEANSNKLDVQTAALQSGVYFLEVQTASGLELVKLVK